ncbi:MAG: hypothetical protein JWN10_2320, partial [Solirubrobacterales bacterium]|nr:hypothetical protein [Solirubrobacterales bacterium]
MNAAGDAVGTARAEELRAADACP